MWTGRKGTFRPIPAALSRSPGASQATGAGLLRYAPSLRVTAPLGYGYPGFGFLIRWFIHSRSRSYYLVFRVIPPSNSIIWQKIREKK